MSDETMKEGRPNEDETVPVEMSDGALETVAGGGSGQPSSGAAQKGGQFFLKFDFKLVAVK